MTTAEMWRDGSRIAMAVGSLALLTIERVSKSPGRFGIYLDNQTGVIMNESRVGTLAALGWLTAFTIINIFVKDRKTSLQLGAIVPIVMAGILIAHEVAGFGGKGMNPIELAPFLLGFLGTVCAVDMFARKFS